eukprot:364163-Chlamydomonas_euryale.AAC.18
MAQASVFRLFAGEAGSNRAFRQRAVIVCGCSVDAIDTASRRRGLARLDHGEPASQGAGERFVAAAIFAASQAGLVRPHAFLSACCVRARAIVLPQHRRCAAAKAQHQVVPDQSYGRRLLGGELLLIRLMRLAERAVPPVSQIAAPQSLQASPAGPPTARTGMPGQASLRATTAPCQARQTMACEVLVARPRAVRTLRRWRRFLVLRRRPTWTRAAGALLASCPQWQTRCAGARPPSWPPEPDAPSRQGRGDSGGAFKLVPAGTRPAASLPSPSTVPHTAAGCRSNGESVWLSTLVCSSATPASTLKLTRPLRILRWRGLEDAGRDVGRPATRPKLTLPSPRLMPGKNRTVPAERVVNALTGAPPVKQHGGRHGIAGL